MRTIKNILLNRFPGILRRHPNIDYILKFRYSSNRIAYFILHKDRTILPAIPMNPEIDIFISFHKADGTASLLMARSSYLRTLTVVQLINYLVSHLGP